MTGQVRQCVGAKGASLDDGLVGGAILKADGIANFMANLAAHLLGNPGSHAHCGHAPRLRAPNLACLAVA